MASCCLLFTSVISPSFTRPSAITLSAAAVISAFGLAGQRRLMPARWPLPHQPVNLRLLLVVLAAHRNGARHVHAVAIELRRVVHQQQIAGFHAVFIGFVMQGSGVYARRHNARIAPMRVAPQKGEFELRLNFVLRRAGNGNAYAR
jgi:hypothetical protein